MDAASRAPGGRRFDGLILGNLVLRLVLLAGVIGFGRWDAGDTSAYIHCAADVWKGAWGSELFRPPLYVWFVALFSPHIQDGPSAAQIAPVLVVQSLLVWAAGAALYRKTRFRWIAIAWLFDPALLIFSNLIMSDALFAVCLLGLGFMVWRFLDEVEAYTPISTLCGLGAFLGLALLGRNIALVPVVFTLAALVWRCRRSLAGLRRLFVVAAVAVAVIAPRLYWDVSRYNTWALGSQGPGWLGMVAGIVEYDGQGLDFIHSELKWGETHRSGDAVASLLKTPGRTAWLSFKGFARVLVGHVNIEWIHYFTGVTPLGPAWFKAQEDRKAPQIQSASLIFWVLGLIFTAGACLAVYVSAFIALRSAHAWRDPFVIWALACALALAAAPLVVGDARFRCAVWPFVLLLWARGRARSQARI